MTFRIKKAIAAAALSLGLSGVVSAQSWQPEFDLLTAGAAASVLLHHICQGAEAGAAAAEHASKRLVHASASVGAVEEATEYARESYRLKLKAFEQTTTGQSCGSLRRLFDIANHTGFPVPRR